MTSYKIKYSKSSQKFLEKNKAIGIKFFKAFTDISTSHDNIKLYDIKKYHNKDYDDIFRLRIGSYRAIFRIVNDKLIILVFDIGARGDIYKKRR